MNLTIETSISKGEFLFSIISPDKQVVYEKEGINVSDSTELEVYEGTWYGSLLSLSTSNADNDILTTLTA